jgi:putative ABC transport system permease protein
LANLIAWPVAYVAMKEWLNHFAFKIDPGLVIFVSASVIALLLAVVGVSLQAFREAKTDPVQVLRSE